MDSNRPDVVPIEEILSCCVLIVAHNILTKMITTSPLS